MVSKVHVRVRVRLITIRVVVRVRETVMINTTQNLRNPNKHHSTVEKRPLPGRIV